MSLIVCTILFAVWFFFSSPCARARGCTSYLRLSPSQARHCDELPHATLPHCNLRPKHFNLRGMGQKYSNVDDFTAAAAAAAASSIAFSAEMTSPLCCVQ